jgi:ribosomal protein S21
MSRAGTPAGTVSNPITRGRFALEAERRGFPCIRAKGANSKSPIQSQEDAIPRIAVRPEPNAEVGLAFALKRLRYDFSANVSYELKKRKHYVGPAKTRRLKEARALRRLRKPRRRTR